MNEKKKKKINIIPILNPRKAHYLMRTKRKTRIFCFFQIYLNFLRQTSDINIVNRL